MRREGEGKEGGEIDSKRGGQSGKEERSVKERGRERDRGGEREREWQRWRGRERACVIARRAHVEVRVRGESGSGNWVFSYDRAAKMFQLFC